MGYSQTKKLKLPNIVVNKEELNNVTVIEPINFISKKENEKIIESLKQSIIDFKNPDKWMTWEESNKILMEKYFSGNL